MPTTTRMIATTKRTLTSGPRSGSTNVCLALSLATGTPPRNRRRMASLHTTRDTLVGVSDRPHRRLPGLRAPEPAQGSPDDGPKRPRRSMVRYDATGVQTLRSHMADLQAQVEQLSGSIGNKQVRASNRRAAAMKGPAGLLPQVGPGVTVTLSDAPQETSASSPDNPNLLLVHQQDIQAVVNAMWKGGAQAITIQGQRVVSSTGIRCIGNSVQLQGVPYSQPYVISAVGDPAALTDAIARDSYLQVYRVDAADPDIAVGWDEQVETSITAPAYDGLLGLTYAKVLPSS